MQAKYDEGWFIPSRAEWAAFANELGINENNYNSVYGLNSIYWTSSFAWSSGGTNWVAYSVRFYEGRVYGGNFPSLYCIRLATTF